jgi:hypothetical protein
MSDASDEQPREIEVQINPLPEFLQAMAISQADFEKAVSLAFDESDPLIEAITDPDDMPSIHETKIIINGKEFNLGDIADITITGDLE